MKKIVIAGALGHIGSKVIHRMPELFPGSQIVMIDNMLTQRYCSLFNLPEQGNYKFIEADVLDLNLVDIFKNADVVMQFAAITDAAGGCTGKTSGLFVVTPYAKVGRTA